MTPQDLRDLADTLATGDELLDAIEALLDPPRQGAPTKDDRPHLARMAVLMYENPGMGRSTAARIVAEELAEPMTTPNATAERLARRWRTACPLLEQPPG